ncbi:hypothetical protein DL93DRAFT_2204067 [Clavulina sp. PMI_390]|nr:hypothetical protein DL93DRAFT_2204067 [Clavulina sp. PMI_390]
MLYWDAALTLRVSTTINVTAFRRPLNGESNSMDLSRLAAPRLRIHHYIHGQPATIQPMSLRIAWLLAVSNLESHGKFEIQDRTPLSSIVRVAGGRSSDGYVKPWQHRANPLSRFRSRSSTSHQSYAVQYGLAQKLDNRSVTYGRSPSTGIKRANERYTEARNLDCKGMLFGRKSKTLQTSLAISQCINHPVGPVYISEKSYYSYLKKPKPHDLQNPPIQLGTCHLGRYFGQLGSHGHSDERSAPLPVTVDRFERLSLTVRLPARQGQ